MLNKVRSLSEKSRVSTRGQTSVSSSGLFGFGLCALFFNLYQAGLFPVDITILAMAVFYGGISQITVGLMEWHKNNYFCAAAFVTFGLFWLSLVGFIILPAVGFGSTPHPSVLAAYFFLWGGFSIILLASATQISPAVRMVFVLLATYFFIFSIGAATESITVRLVAAYFGLAGGCTALYAGTTLIVNQVFDRPVLPWGQPR